MNEDPNRPDFLNNKIERKHTVFKKGSVINLTGRPWFVPLLPAETYKEDTLSGLLTMKKTVTLRLEFEYEI